jgi:hypothetical protein
MVRVLRGSARSSLMAQLMSGTPSYNAKNGRYNVAVHARSQLMEQQALQCEQLQANVFHRL